MLVQAEEQERGLEDDWHALHSEVQASTQNLSENTSQCPSLHASHADEVRSERRLLETMHNLRARNAVHVLRSLFLHLRHRQERHPMGPLPENKAAAPVP